MGNVQLISILPDWATSVKPCQIVSYCFNSMILISVPRVGPQPAFDVQVVPAFLIIEQIRKPSSEEGKYYFDGKIKSTYLGEQLPKINEDIKDWLSDSTSTMDSTNMSTLSEKHR